MKASTSENNFSTPSFLQSSTAAGYVVDSGTVPNSLTKVAHVSHTKVEEESLTHKFKNISDSSDKSSKNNAKLGKQILKANPVINTFGTLVESPHSSELFYNEQTYHTNACTSKANKTKNIPESTALSVTLDTYSSQQSHENNNQLALFIKSITGEKAFGSISLISISFFVSGILLMFYLIRLA